MLAVSHCQEYTGVKQWRLNQYRHAHRFCASHTTASDWQRRARAERLHTYDSALPWPITQLTTSYTEPNFDPIWWRKISQPICIRMFDSLQYDSAKCAPQYELNSFVTVATYWAPDLTIVKDFVTFGVPFWHLLMVPGMHDPASIWICKLEFVGSFNVFWAKYHQNIEIK